MEKKSCEVEYGLVKIINGEFKGRFAFYDDDDENKSIIYFGNMYDNANYYLINHEYITNDYTLDDLKKRKSEIMEELCSETSDYQRLTLLEEKKLIDSVLCNTTTSNNIN